MAAPAGDRGALVPQEQELDLQAMRRMLLELNREVEEAQVRVIATVEAKHAEFVAASDQAADLRGAVARLQSDLRRAASLLGEQRPQGADAQGAERTPEQQAADAQAPVPRLHAAVARHGDLKADLEAMDAAATVLNTMLEVQRQFGQLDTLTHGGQYAEAAELTLEIAGALQGISAPDARAEPAMVRATKMQYYQRRAILTTRLEDQLAQLISFGDRTTSARASSGDPPTTLRQVWGALYVLDLRDRRVDQLADRAHRALLRPLLDAARRLRPGQRIRPRSSTHGDQETWSWSVVDDGDRGAENRPADNVQGKPGDKVSSSRPPVHAVLPALESLFQFAHEHWAAGLSEILATLGRHLWPPVARGLVRHFESCEGDSGGALERFEQAMFAKGLVGAKEKTLTKHVHEHRHALGEQRRANILAEARQWLLQEDAALVPVRDATEPGCVTQLLEKVAPPPSSEEDAAGPQTSVLSESLAGALRDDEGLLRLPSMSVSAGAHKLVGRLRDLMDELTAFAEKGRLDAARDLSKLARELCTLFSVLRPYVQKGQLKASPQYCGTFMADCLYLTHVLILMPYTYGKRLPSEHQQLAFFVDLVPQLRRLGENHFLVMLRYQQEQICESLRSCDFAAGISRDRAFNAAETALGGALQRVKSAAQGLSLSLPAQLLREVVGSLLGVICQSLLGKLFQLQRVEPEEISSLSALLTTALATASHVCSGTGPTSGRKQASDSEDMAEVVPGWSALTVAADLLGSDFSRFLEKRADVVKALKKDEAMKLMQLSWQNEMFSPEAAWERLSRK